MRKRWDSACYRELGAELRKHRREAGLTEAKLGRQLGWSASKVARSEFGQVKLSTIDVITYLAFCGVYGKRSAELRAMCREAEATSGHWLRRHESGLPDATRALIYHESTANASTSYEPELVPGLLQTEGYIRVLMEKRWPGWDPKLAVRIRKTRQRILHGPDPARFNFFVHENALQLAVGDATIMHEQLLALLLLDGLPQAGPFQDRLSSASGGATRGRWRAGGAGAARHLSVHCGVGATNASFLTPSVRKASFVARLRSHWNTWRHHSPISNSSHSGDLETAVLPQVALRVVPAGALATVGGPFVLFEYTNHEPLVYLEAMTCGLFLEDSEYVEDYRNLVSIIADVALGEGHSREYLAALASDYDREGVDSDAHDGVEEKQLQR
jgi:transcriptional regulator with XRE-family HTH domain